MIDIHCHILPGMDDGPEQLEHAMTMAEDAIADGITHVIATPHANNHYHFDYQRVRRIRGALQERLGDRLHVATGCDFHLNPENLAALKVDPARFCEDLARNLLIENPRAVFEGRPLPYVPEVLDEKPRRRRKRFFFF